MSGIPVRCQNCKLVFNSGPAIGLGVSNITLRGNRTTCPRCDEMVPLIEGQFESGVQLHEAARELIRTIRQSQNPGETTRRMLQKAQLSNASRSFKDVEQEEAFWPLFNSIGWAKMSSSTKAQWVQAIATVLLFVWSVYSDTSKVPDSQVVINHFHKHSDTERTSGQPHDYSTYESARDTVGRQGQQRTISQVRQNYLSNG